MSYDIVVSMATQSLDRLPHSQNTCSKVSSLDDGDPPTERVNHASFAHGTKVFPPRAILV